MQGPGGLCYGRARSGANLSYRSMSLKTRGLLAVSIGVILGLSLSLGSVVLADRDVKATSNLPWDEARLLAEVLERVKRDYVDDVDDAELIEAAIRGMVERAWEAFPDYHEELRYVMGEGAFVVARFTISGTQSGQWGVLPATRRRVSFDEIVRLELRDGRVVHQSGIADNLTALRQLEVLPGQGS